MPLNTDFKSTIEFLNSLLLDKDADKKQITDADLKDADLAAIQERAKTYTGYLKNYVSDYKDKTQVQKVMKGWFFAITMFLLLCIVVASSIALVIIAKKETIRINDIATIVTAMASAVSSFLVLPKVIAENLFPSKEEDKTAEVFSKMFEHDISLRGLYHITENIERGPEVKTDIMADSKKE